MHANDNLARVAATLPTALADRAALARAVEIAETIVERRNTYPILANVRLRGDGDVLFVTSTNLDIMIDVAIPAPADSGFDVTLPAYTLRQLLKSAPPAEFVALTAPEVVRGKNGPEFADGVSLDFESASYALNGLPPEGFPELKAGPFSHRFTMSGAELFAALDSVAFAMSCEETRYYLNGIFMHVIEAPGCAPEFRCIATDGHRMGRREMAAPDGASGMPGVILPRFAVATLLKLLKGKACPETVDIEVGAEKMRLQWDNVTLTTKLIEGTFPDYERVTPKNNNKWLSVNAAGALAAIKAAALIASDAGGKAVAFDYADGELTVRVENPDSGSSAVPLALASSDMPSTFVIGFNAKYLAEMIAEARAETVTIAFDQVGSPAIIRGDGRDGWMGVLMPMRV